MKRVFILSLLLFVGFAIHMSPAEGSSPLASSSGLIGEWSRSDAAGERLNVRFFADGSYKLEWILQSSVSKCTSTVFGEKTGNYSTRGDLLAMTDATSVLTSKDTCHPQSKYEKHRPLLASTYHWRLSRTTNGLLLILHRPDGKDTIYAREAGAN